MNIRVSAIAISVLMLLSLVVIIVHIAPRVTAPTTLYVDDDNTGFEDGSQANPYNTIQEGIDNASSGDTVFVYNGTYYENVVVNKNINLQGEDRKITVIDGWGGQDVVKITVDWVNISEFTVTGADSFNVGIFFNNVQNCSLFNNNISSNNNISGNNISSNNVDGIWVYESPTNIIINNNFVNDGIYISGDQLAHYNSHTISDNNIVNSKPLYYYKNRDSIIIDGIPTGQLILANCSDVKVNNLQITDTSVGMEVAYSINVSITYNNISDNGRGMYLLNSSWINITGNDFINNGNGGIIVKRSSNNTMGNNHFSENLERAISLTSSLNNCITNNNIFPNNGGGISLSLSSNNTITNNNVSFNLGTGFTLGSGSNNHIRNNIALGNSGDGLGSQSSTNNNITGNNFSSNTGRGIYFWLSSSNTIACNYISNNSKGIYLWSTSMNNLVYHNNIINNTNQASDQGTNFWDNGYPSGGNYWSDYNGVDLNSTSTQDVPPPDGIGDTNHTIPDGSNVDNYPLMNPIKNPLFLSQGWNLISIPFLQSDTDINSALSSINGSYDSVWLYNVSDPFDCWKHYHISKPPYMNDLSIINHTMGFWIHITESDGALFLYSGTPPRENQTIDLHPGWNLVGYPSNSGKLRDDALGNLVFDDDIYRIRKYDATAGKMEDVTVSDNFELGQGYWIYANKNCVWEVPL